MRKSISQRPRGWQRASGCNCSDSFSQKVTKYLQGLQSHWGRTYMQTHTHTHTYTHAPETSAVSSRLHPRLTLWYLIQISKQLLFKKKKKKVEAAPYILSPSSGRILNIFSPAGFACSLPTPFPGAFPSRPWLSPRLPPVSPSFPMSLSYQTSWIKTEKA